jgi:hypothetical protein
MMMSPQYQLHDQQKRNFITALLKKETGAVIGDAEMAWADKTYFPQLGDSEELIEDKRQAREQAAQQMEQSGDPQSAGFAQRMRQASGAERGGLLRKETGAVISDAEKEAIIAALLKKESGAVISKSEIDWADKTYFPQLFDTEETVNQKAQALEQALGTARGGLDSRNFLDRLKQERTPIDQAPRLMDGSPIPEGMVINPIKTMEYRDYNQNGVEDRSEGIYLEKDLIPERDIPPELQIGGRNFYNMLPAPMPQLGRGQRDRLAESVDPMQELSKALQELELQKSQTKDPSEIKLLDKMIENASIVANAPYAGLMEEVAATGGEDDLVAHVRSGDLNVSRELIQKNPKIEKEIEKTAVEMGLDPEEMVHGTGLASLNVYTGMEQHGFLKKIAKGIKKVVKKIAPIAGPLANFIPGVGPVLAGVIGAGTNLAAGKGLKGAITGGLSGFGAGKLMGGIGSLGTVGGKAVGSGNFGALGFGDKLAALRTGLGSGNLASTFFNPAQGSTGIFGGQIGPGIRRGIGSLFGFGQPVAPGMPGSTPPFNPNAGVPSQYQIQSGDTLGQIARQSGMTVDQLLSANPQITDPNMIFAGQSLNIPGMAAPAQGGFLSNLFTGGGRDNVGNFGMIGDMAGGFTDRLGLTNYGLAGQQGGGGGMFSGMGGIGGLAAAGIPAYFLGKMAYDEAKKDRGVPLTPLTTMGPTGRYNIEAEIAKRMGTQMPNPVEFGLLPRGTIPTLSGGQPMAAAGGGAVYPMAFAEGGNVAMEDFERMNGRIDGPGTETSDDIPAMLSDGEFVMTGAAVRGAGGFEMQNRDGILTLTPAGTPDRERGTNMMYEMMDLFGSYANANA